MCPSIAVMAAKKKVAKKKVAKRKAPSRPCVKCGKPVHPRAKTCPACKAAQPQPKPKAKKKAAPKASKAMTGGSVVSQISKVAADIEIMEAKVAAKRKELAKLVAKL